MKTDAELLDLAADMDADALHDLLTLEESDRVVKLLTERHERMEREVELLRPYWGPGVTKKEAIAAYLAANPDHGT